MNMLCQHEEHYAKAGFRLAMDHVEQLTTLAKSYESLRNE